MKRASLFREEALAASRVPWLGEIVLIRPLSFTFFTAMAAALALGICAFFFLSGYTRHSNVAGQLTSNLGIVKVYPPQAGVILKKMVMEGQAVSQGDVLYVVSSERQTSGSGAVQQAISQQVARREQSLRDELLQTRRIQQDEQIALQKKLLALQKEQSNVIHQLASQRKRVELSEEALKRGEQLLAQGFISRETLQQKQADLLDQNLRQQALERDQISVGRELLATQSDISSQPVHQQNQLAQIERLLANTTQEWTESEAKRSIAITAPESGLATAINAEVGQTVDGSKPVASIIPQGAQLEAHLYAPSRSIGFVRVNDQVLLRYQAFPYQKFGHAHGTVTSISQAALPASEFSATADTNTASEPLYRIKVKLDRQSLTAYGKQQSLQAGMQVEGDLLQEHRKLYEWVLEPLYSLTGKL